MSVAGKRVQDAELESFVYVGESEIHGRGLFAARTLSAGSYIGTFHGPVVETDGEHVLWVYPDGPEESPEGRVGENLLRFLNHGSPCNANFEGFDLYACCKIAKGQEITIDYDGTG